MEIDILGIDLAKRVFQLHGADRSGHALHQCRLFLRAQAADLLRTGCADLIEAAGMFRRAHPCKPNTCMQTVSMSPKKSLQSAPVPYMHESRDCPSHGNDTGPPQKM